MTQKQLGFNASVEQHPNALAALGPQPQQALGELIQAPTLDVMDAGITPIEGRPVHHIGMGDQAVARSRQQTGHGQGITGKAPLITADPCGDHQQRGQRLAHTSSTASSRNHCPSGLGSAAVIAQRKGSPWAAKAWRQAATRPCCQRCGSITSSSSNGCNLTFGTDQIAPRRAHLLGRPAAAHHCGVAPHTAGQSPFGAAPL